VNSNHDRARKRLYYSIGDAAKLVGVKPSVLRFWETEFPFLRPRKNKAGNRIYRPADLKRLLLVRHLLHDEGYTIAGAKKHLERAGESEQLSLWVERQSAEALLNSIRGDVRALMAILEKGTVDSA
jgi:DNA-binding transcriptional MerR regulator